MNLASLFAKVAHKRLVTVDLPDAGSHQHELNGVAALKDFFGAAETTKADVTWHYFADDQEPLQTQGEVTFYDARARSAARTKRSEWRLYYYGDALKKAAVGDLLILAKTRDESTHALVFQKNSAWDRAAGQLFRIAPDEVRFVSISQETMNASQVQFIQEQIIAELDLGIVLPSAPSDEEIITRQFPNGFPTTKDMSAFARTQIDTNPAHADQTLIGWLEREEQLFRALEKITISSRLQEGFTGKNQVDDFLKFSLSVQNRRKSRMGHALQNHLEELFRQHNLSFTAQARTESRNKPDFIFPGQNEYQNPRFDAALLVMLGVKSTSKDRWRQVLTEADRIPKKHLCTLEAGISEAQTSEMLRQHLTLVIPESLHNTYTFVQRTRLLNIEGFIDFVRSKKRN